MMKSIRFLSVLIVVLVLCCGCQRTVNPEQKGNITLYQMADDGSKLQSSKYEIQADQEDNVAVIQELLDCFKKRVTVKDFQLKEKQLLKVTNLLLTELKKKTIYIWNFLIQKSTQAV